jgi:hypothetical protein
MVENIFTLFLRVEGYLPMKSIIAGIILGAATLALASHVNTHPSFIPIPLCPPEHPNCPANQ